MASKPNADHIAQILHALTDATEGHTHEYHREHQASLSLTAEEIKAKTPKLNNSERTNLIETLRYNRLTHHVEGRSMRKYKPLAERHPGGRIIWKWGITEQGFVYLWHYDLFQEVHSLLKDPRTGPHELEFEIIPDSIRPPKGAPLGKAKQPKIRPA
jgi:hypothetical protein